jgi:hypothetical protein
MLDPIQAAVQKAGTITSIPTPPIPPVTLTDIKAKVPVVPDPNLVKRQLEAEAQLKVTEAKETALKAKEEAVNKAKAAAGNLQGAATAAAGAAVAGLLAKIPKPPLVDPKILATLSALKQIKDLAKEKRNAGKQNLAKGKELFKFPLTPPSTVVQAPKIPPLPALPFPSTLT